VPTDSLLGAFEELVLLAVVHLGADAYGMRGPDGSRGQHRGGVLDLESA